MIDTHIHTRFSTDSETNPLSFILRAIDLGLEAITFTDHYDLDYQDGILMHFDIDEYFNELLELKEKYKERIKVLIGIEIGMQKHISERLVNVIKDYPFDYIIGSTHLIRGMDPYFRQLYDENTIKQNALDEYFDTMYDNIASYDLFDSMGHIDYLKRYTPFEDNGIYYNDNKEKIDSILKHLIARNKAIEINTSGIEVYPFDFEILKRFKELGGKYVTLGSDAHKHTDLCRHFDSTIEKIKHYGFDKITYFENRIPVQINL